MTQALKDADKAVMLDSKNSVCTFCRIYLKRCMIDLHFPIKTHCNSKCRNLSFCSLSGCPVHSGSYKEHARGTS